MILTCALCLMMPNIVKDDDVPMLVIPTGSHKDEDPDSDHHYFTTADGAQLCYAMHGAKSAPKLLHVGGLTTGADPHRLRSTRDTPREVFHAGVAEPFNTDIRSMLMVL